MELFHEKNGHSKKLQKNKRKLSPIYFFKKNNVIKLPTEDQKIINIRGESGRLIEHFIKYKKKVLFINLKLILIIKIFFVILIILLILIFKNYMKS